MSNVTNSVRRWQNIFHPLPTRRHRHDDDRHDAVVGLHSALHSCRFNRTAVIRSLATMDVVEAFLQSLSRTRPQQAADPGTRAQLQFTFDTLLTLARKAQARRYVFPVRGRLGKELGMECMVIVERTMEELNPNTASDNELEPLPKGIRVRHRFSLSSS